MSAKDGCQETAVGLLGLILSIFVFSYLESEENFSYISCFLFGFLTFFHLLTNYFAVSSVVLESLNPIRYSQIIEKFMSDERHQVPTPSQISCEEKFLSFSAIIGAYPLPIRFAAPFEVLLNNFEEKENGQILKDVMNQSDSENYLIQFQEKKKQTVVVLHSDCTSEDILKAFFHSWLLTSASLQPKYLSNPSKITNDVNSLFPTLLSEMENKGWDIQNASLLCGERWTAKWTNKQIEKKNL